MQTRTALRLSLAFAVLLLAFATKWCFFSSKQATVRISPTAFARFQSKGIYQWFTKDGVPLTYFEDNKPVGDVRFEYGPETYLEGIFPGPDSQTIICVYGTDLTIGVFAVELNKRSAPAVPPPEGMFKSGIVKSTNFGLRRCTKPEVDQLMRSIDSASDDVFREMTYPRYLLDLHYDKTWLLKAIENGSGLYDKVPPAGQIPEVDPSI